VEATFHGTRAESVEQILREGLDPSTCSTGAYGKGAYVGTHAGVAHQYADPDASGLRHMCIILVIVSDRFVKGRQGVMPPKTAVDRLVNPTQYCFVDDARLYISHLLTYRVKGVKCRRVGGGWNDVFQKELSSAVHRAASGQRSAASQKDLAANSAS